MLKKLDTEEKKEQQSPDSKGENKFQTLTALLPVFVQTSPVISAIITTYPPFLVPPVPEQSFPIVHPPA